MDLIEVFRHYKASWRVYLFLWQSTVWSHGADSERSAVLCVNCMLCRLTAGNCMLLRWKMRQKLVPMKFFSHGWKVCQYQVIVTNSLLWYIVKRNVWGTFEIMIMLWYFYSLLFEYFPYSVRKNRNNIWAPFWCVCFPVFLSLSFSHFEISRITFQSFFLLEMYNIYKNIKLYCCSSYPILSFRAGPWWHQPENGSFNLQENKLRILISKSALFSPWKKRRRKNCLLCENL